MITYILKHTGVHTVNCSAWEASHAFHTFRPLSPRMVFTRNNNFRNTDDRERLNSFTRRLFLLVTFRLASPLSSSGRSFILLIFTIINEWNYIRVSHFRVLHFQCIAQIRPFILLTPPIIQKRVVPMIFSAWYFRFLIFILSNFDFTTSQSCSCTH